MDPWTIDGSFPMFSMTSISPQAGQRAFSVSSPNIQKAAHMPWPTGSLMRASKRPYACENLPAVFSLAEVYRRLGRNAEAAAILKRIVDKSVADHNVIPEMYVSLPCKLFPGKIGDPTGAMPMVGYGAGVYILDLLQRAELDHQS